MSPSSENGGGLYEVHCSGAFAATLKNMQKQASEEGRGEECLAAFKRIVQQLRHDPMNAGEPQYRLPALHMQIRSVAV